MRIAVVGPVSAAAIADFVDPKFRDEALRHPANHGTPIGALVRHLLERGHQLVVVSHRRGHDEVHMTGPNLEFFQAASRSSPWRQMADGFRAERRSMVKFLRTQCVDVTHAHWTYEWAWAAASARIAPLVVTVHDAPITVLIRNRGLYWLGRVVLGIRARIAFREAQLTAVSPTVAGRFRRQMKWNDAIQIIPNCVDLETSGEFESPDSTLRETITEIADGSRLKNVRGLLRAFKLVRNRVPSASLQLIGPELAEDGRIARWATRHDLSSGVAFLGQLDRPEVLTRLSHSAIHVHASLEESFGLSVLEAMALGVPTVASDGSGGPEWLLSGGAGLVVDTRKPDLLANAIVSLLDSDEVRESIRKVASARFKQTFEPGAVAYEYESLYLSVVSTKRCETQER